MKTDFDKHLKKKLDNASPDEVGHSLNSDKLWGKIEQKKKGTRIRFMPWMSHAAAIAAGLAIGFFFFTKQTNNTTAPDTDVAKQQLKPSITTVHDTVFIVKKETAPDQEHHSYLQKQNQTFTAHKATNNANRIATQQSKQHVQNVLKDDIQPQTNETKAPEQAPGATFLAALPKQVKVLHLSDMNNENTPATISAKKKPISIFVLSKDLPPESNTETISMLVVKTLSNSKK